MEPPTFCGSVPPVVARACDGNPDAAAKTTTVVTEQEDGPYHNCPANEVGVTLNLRQVTTVTRFACVNHQVQQTDQSVQYGAWVKESHCHDLIANRCAHDQLSSREAKGRFQWLLRCADENKELRHFLDQYAEVQFENLTMERDPGNAYPIFATEVNGQSQPWMAPTSLRESCQLPAHTEVVAVCQSSSVTPEQLVLVDDSVKKFNEVRISEAAHNGLQKIATLSVQSSWNDRDLKATHVQNWVIDRHPSEHIVLNFKMKSGRRLTVTENHLLLDQYGAMRMAQDFMPGDSLIRETGEPDRIAEIYSSLFQGRVYNVFVDSDVAKKNVIVTNGYLNGSAYFQNEAAQELNRGLLREKFIKGVFVK